MSEQGKNALEGKLHNHGGDIHVEYGGLHHYVIAQVSRHEVIDERQATLLAEQIVLSWNEHNTLLRQRDDLVKALEDLKAIRLEDYQRTAAENKAWELADAVLAKCKENQ
jgi:hypothetical protein